MLKLSELSKQQQWQLMRKGANLCPICGGKPSIRCPKSKLCERHAEMKAAYQRKRIKAKRRFIPLSSWAQVDWNLGAKEIAKLLGVSRLTVQRNYRKVVRLLLVKPVKGFIGEVGKPLASPKTPPH
jgi:hypothetical protein